MLVTSIGKKNVSLSLVFHNMIQAAMLSIEVRCTVQILGTGCPDFGFRNVPWRANSFPYICRFAEAGAPVADELMIKSSFS